MQDKSKSMKIITKTNYIKENRIKLKKIIIYYLIKNLKKFDIITYFFLPNDFFIFFEKI